MEKAKESILLFLVIQLIVIMFVALYMKVDRLSTDCSLSITPTDTTEFNVDIIK